MTTVVDREDAGIGRHDLGGDEIVDRQAVLAGQEPDPATRRDAADADGGRVAERDRQSVRRGCRRDVSGRETRLGPGEPPVRIDQDRLHRRKIEDDSALARAVAGNAVAAAPNGQLEPCLSREGDGPRDIRRVGGADDECRLAIVPGVVGTSRRIELIVGGLEQRSV